MYSKSERHETLGKLSGLSIIVHTKTFIDLYDID